MEFIVILWFVKEKVLEGDLLIVSSSKFEVVILDEYVLLMFVVWCYEWFESVYIICWFDFIVCV